MTSVMHLFHRKNKNKDKDGAEEKDKNKDKDKEKDKDKDKASKDKSHQKGLMSDNTHSSFFPSVFSSRQDPKPLPNVPSKQATDARGKQGESLLSSDPTPPPLPPRGEEHVQLRQMQSTGGTPEQVTEISGAALLERMDMTQSAPTPVYIPIGPPTMAIPTSLIPNAQQAQPMPQHQQPLPQLPQLQLQQLQPQSQPPQQTQPNTMPQLPSQPLPQLPIPQIQQTQTTPQPSPVPSGSDSPPPPPVSQRQSKIQPQKKLENCDTLINIPSVPNAPVIVKDSDSNDSSHTTITLTDLIENGGNTSSSSIPKEPNTDFTLNMEPKTSNENKPQTDTKILTATLIENYESNRKTAYTGSSQKSSQPSPPQQSQHNQQSQPQPKEPPQLQFPQVYGTPQKPLPLFPNNQAQSQQPQPQPQPQQQPPPQQPQFHNTNAFPFPPQPQFHPPIPQAPQQHQYSQMPPPFQSQPQFSPAPQHYQQMPQQMPSQMPPIQPQLPMPPMPQQMPQTQRPQPPPSPRNMYQPPPQGFYSPPPQQQQQPMPVPQQLHFTCPQCGTQQMVDSISEHVRCYQCGQISRVLATRPPPQNNNFYNQRPPNPMMGPAPPPRFVEPNIPQPGYNQALPLESMMAPSSSKYVWHIDYHELVIEQLIGQGAFGQVFKGKWNGTPVAIKKLLPEAIDRHNIEEFMSEISVMSKLRHPNLVLFMGACLSPPNLCIVTEFVTKGSLFDMIHNKKIPINSLAMAMDAARGVNYLHCFKPTIIHRDLKTANLLVDTSNSIKVCDFGFTVAKGGPGQMQLCGTLSYMAPEMMRGLNYDEKVDVYSFGVVLWEMVTLQIPFLNMSNDDIMHKVMHQNYQLPIPTSVPPPIAQLIMDCWQVEPRMRPSFGQILSQLEFISNGMKK